MCPDFFVRQGAFPLTGLPPGKGKRRSMTEKDGCRRRRGRYETGSKEQAPEIPAPVPYADF